MDFTIQSISSVFLDWLFLAKPSYIHPNSRSHPRGQRESIANPGITLLFGWMYRNWWAMNVPRKPTGGVRESPDIF